MLGSQAPSISSSYSAFMHLSHLSDFSEPKRCSLLGGRVFLSFMEGEVIGMLPDELSYVSVAFHTCLLLGRRNSSRVGRANSISTLRVRVMTGSGAECLVVGCSLFISC